MSSITVPRANVTTDEVTDALRQGLGSRYKVLPGTDVNLLTLANRLWIVRKARQVLRAAPSLR